VVVEVTPEGVRVPGKQPGVLQMTDAGAIAKRRMGSDDSGPSLRARVAPRAGPVTLPDWSPRMPLGIWSYGSQVLVRNVTIQALN